MRAQDIHSYLYYRHTLPVRVMHWINVVALTILMMSGLQIFNAHPALYWAKSSYSGKPPLLQITSRNDDVAGPIGVTRVFGYEFNSTGVLGLREHNGRLQSLAFPGWITIPGYYSLAEARSWHFFFAWVFVLNGITYLLYSIYSRHLTRDLLPTRPELKTISVSIKDHLLLRHPTGDASRRYNVLQKLAYVAVIFILLPLVILMGWAMSPWLDSILPGWVDLFGGRQAARTIHFIVAWLLVAFVLIHVFEVIVSGLWNHMRSMITGQYRVKEQAR